MSEPAAGRTSYRDKEGKPLTLLEWTKLWEDPEYIIVAETERDGALIRTCWHGLDDGVRVAPMYVTGIQRGEKWREVERLFWPVTLAEAEAAHVVAAEFILGD